MMTQNHNHYPRIQPMTTSMGRVAGLDFGLVTLASLCMHEAQEFPSTGPAEVARSQI